MSFDGEANFGSDFKLLADWLDGRLPEHQAEAVRAAVPMAEPATQATVQWLHQFRILARAMPLSEPPPVVRQHLRRYFRLWSRARAALSQPPAQLIATLLFDSRLDLATAGVRGVDDQDSAAHLAYTSDRADLVLDLTRNGDGQVRVDGQVLAGEDEEPVFEAMVVGPYGVIRTVDGDELGRFSLPSVPDDTTELRVTNGDLTIVAALDLRGSEPVV
jgi:hypothetical protein